MRVSFPKKKGPHTPADNHKKTCPTRKSDKPFEGYPSIAIARIVTPC